MKSQGTGLRIWSSPAWRAAAEDWLDEKLAAVGRVRTGAVEQPHLRAWSTVLRAPTDAGPVWLKAMGAETAFEVELYALLTRVVPEYVVHPLAADPRRGWLLLPDGGTSLGVRLDGTARFDALLEVMPHYAELQRALAAHSDAMVALGVADMRPEAMPGRFEEALATCRALTAHPIAHESLDRVEAMRDTYRGWCERLADLPGGASLDHNDLHPWNVLSGPRFYDWGDAVVAHPFSSMLVALDAATDVERTRDAYLRPFRDLAPHDELVEALELSCRVAKVARCLIWARALNASAGEEIEPRFALAPLESLLGLLDRSYLAMPELS